MKVALALLLTVLAALHLALPWSVFRVVDHSTATLLLTDLRLPRTLLALGYGAVLGISGAALQAVFANPLASPDITGSSSGAAVGAVIGSYWLGLTGPLALAAAGATGAGLTLLLLVFLAGRRADPTTMLLAGVAISLAMGALTTLALATAPSPFAFYDAFDWLMGSFVDRSAPQALAALIPATIACIWLVRQVRALDLLALGEDVAASLGVQPRRLTRDVITAVSVAVGACVSVCGAIGFIGLAAPVIARAIERGHPGRCLPLAGILGATLMVAADLAVRAVPLNRPLPVGVVTALFGTPLFVWMVIRARRSLTS